MTNFNTINSTEYAAPDATKWVQRYADEFFRYAVARVYDTPVAEDIVAETFFSAYKALHRFEQKSSEKTWLYAILKNKIIDHHRSRTKHLENLQNILEKQNKHDFFEDDGHWKQESMSTNWVTEDTGLEKQEFYQTLHACLAKLPEQQRSVFTLKLLEEKESDEICDELKITSANFWVIMHRSKLLLRGCLGKNWFKK